MEAQIIDLKQWKAAHPPAIVCLNAGLASAPSSIFCSAWRRMTTGRPIPEISNFQPCAFSHRHWSKTRRQPVSSMSSVSVRNIIVSVHVVFPLFKY